MKDKDKDKFSIEEETEWRIQVLKRTARISAAKAKQLERERNAMRRKEPLEDREGLEGTLRCIDNVMEWRFVDEFGRVELDADMLSMHISCFWTKTTCRRLRCTGRSTSNSLSASTIASTKRSFPRLPRMSAVTRSVPRWLARGMDPAKLKYIMGHSDISVTYNTFTHLGFEDVRSDMLRMTDGAA